MIVLGVIVIAAAGLRLTYVLTVTRYDRHLYDATYYELQAKRIANGDGFTDPLLPIIARGSKPMPAADHPPLTVLVLTPVAWVFPKRQLPLRFETAIFGTCTALLLGLLGRRLFGDTAGLVAAGLAAVYPGLWMNDGLIMSEAVCALVVTLALLATYRLLRRPTPASAAVLGVACGLAALTRAELLLLAPLLAGWLLLPRSGVGAFRARSALAGLLVLATVLTITPWFVYNQTRFSRTVIMSTNDGIAMLGSNCDLVYHGTAIGLTNFRCLPQHAPAGDQSVVSRDYVTRSLRFMSHHKSRLPIVIAARVGRDWSFFRPNDMLVFNQGEGRPKWATVLGLVFYYPMFVLAVLGVFVLARRRVHWWPLVATAVVVTVSSVFSYGQTRFRISAEPSIVLLSAVAIVAMVNGARRRTPVRDPDPVVDAS